MYSMYIYQVQTVGLGVALDVYNMPAEQGTEAAANTGVSCHQPSVHDQVMVEEMGEIIQERAEKETRPYAVGLRGFWTPRPH